MISIHQNFTGGNICVKKQEGCEIWLENELRDTVCDWFYWAFCIEGAQGQTLTFHFQKNRLGYFGPAVSHDLENWQWLENLRFNHTNRDGSEEEYFTYTFGETESKVYFAHHMLYHPARFLQFAQRQNLPVKTLCLSRKGREIPFTVLKGSADPDASAHRNASSGQKKIVLTSRHHACESTGNYIMEGILEELCKEPIPGFDIFCVPFVDYDGVVDGDQGKARAPHDPNRDYEEDKEAIYPAVKAIRKYIMEEKVLFGFDFHSPWHCGGVRDRCFIVQKAKKVLDRLKLFGTLLEKNMTPRAFGYRHEDDYPPDFGWNHSDDPTFANFVMDMAGTKLPTETTEPMAGSAEPMASSAELAASSAELAFSLETAYFGSPSNPFSPDGVMENGRCFARALREYIKVRKI